MQLEFKQSTTSLISLSNYVRKIIHLNCKFTIVRSPANDLPPKYYLIIWLYVCDLCILAIESFDFEPGKKSTALILTHFGLLIRDPLVASHHSDQSEALFQVKVVRDCERIAERGQNESELRLQPLSTTRPLVACHVISLSQSEWGSEQRLRLQESRGKRSKWVRIEATGKPFAAS